MSQYSYVTLEGVQTGCLNILRLHLKESRQGVCYVTNRLLLTQNGGGREFDGQLRCAAQAEDCAGVLGEGERDDGQAGGADDDDGGPGVQEGHGVAERLPQVLVLSSRLAHQRAQLRVAQRP